MRRVLRRPAPERETVAEEIARRLDPAMSALGIIFVLVVVGQTVAEQGSALGRVLEVAAWAIWAVFVLEFVLRMVVAPSTTRFLRRNWWQLIFLAVPFLRFVRALRAIRLVRAGRVLSSAVRGTRSAARNLTGRLGWLTGVTTIVILAASQLLYEFADFESYADALHRTALATITGEPIARPGWLSKLMEVALALYSVVVFASVAATLGAYFIEQRDEPRPDQVPTRS